MADEISIRIIENDGGGTAASMTRPLAGTDYPVSKWQKGEVIRAQYDLFLSDLKPGTYRLSLTVFDETTLSQNAQVTTKSFQVE